MSETIDLSKLTAAPWQWKSVPNHEGYEGPLGSFVNSDGTTVFDFGDCTGYYPTCGREPSQTDIEFIALARNAFDVMMRRGWHAERDDGMWDVPSIRGDLIGIASNDAKDVPLWPDPFTALVEADRWYRENIEETPCPSH